MAKNTPLHLSAWHHKQRAGRHSLSCARIFGRNDGPVTLEALRRFYDDEHFVEKLLTPSPSVTASSAELDRIREELESLVQREAQLVEGQLRALAIGADTGVYEKMLLEVAQTRRKLKTRRDEISSAPLSTVKVAQIRRQIEGLRELLDYESLSPGTEDFQRLHNSLLHCSSQSNSRKNFSRMHRNRAAGSLNSSSTGEARSAL